MRDKRKGRASPASMLAAAAEKEKEDRPRSPAPMPRPGCPIRPGGPTAVVGSCPALAGPVRTTPSSRRGTTIAPWRLWRRRFTGPVAPAAMAVGVLRISTSVRVAIATVLLVVPTAAPNSAHTESGREEETARLHRPQTSWRQHQEERQTTTRELRLRQRQALGVPVRPPRHRSRKASTAWTTAGTALPDVAVASVLVAAAVPPETRSIPYRQEHRPTWPSWAAPRLPGTVASAPQVVSG